MISLHASAVIQIWPVCMGALTDFQGATAEDSWEVQHIILRRAACFNSNEGRGVIGVFVWRQHEPMPLVWQLGLAARSYSCLAIILQAMTGSAVSMTGTRAGTETGRPTRRGVSGRKLRK